VGKLGSGIVLNKNLQPYYGCLMPTSTIGEIREWNSFKQKLTTLQWMFDATFTIGEIREWNSFKQNLTTLLWMFDAHLYNWGN
jgi:hypothetical protein